MNRFSLSLLLLTALAALFAFASTSDHHLRKSEFQLQSATRLTSSVFSIASLPNSITYRKNAPSSEPLRLADPSEIIAGLMQLPQMNSAETYLAESVLLDFSVDFFQRPKANVMLVVLGATDRMKLPESIVYGVSHKKRTPLDTLVSFLTGTRSTSFDNPSHGIPAEKWMVNGRSVDAFSSVLSSHTSASIVDIFAQSYETSRVVSVSASEKYAQAANFHKELVTEENSNLRIVKSLSNQPTSFSLTHARIPSVAVSENGDKIVVSLPNGMNVEFFASSEPEIVTLLAELDLLASSLSLLNSDNSLDPEMAVFVISTLQAALDKISASSASLLAANRVTAIEHLVSEFISSFTSTVSKGYAGAALVEVAMLSTSPATVVGDHGKLKTIFNSFKTQLKVPELEHFVSHLPNVYTRLSSFGVCDKLGNAVEEAKLSDEVAVRCKSSSNNNRRDAGDNLLAAASYVPCPPQNLTSVGAWPAIFNIVLWLSLILIIGIVAVVYALMSMSSGSDSMLYRGSAHSKRD